jgi:uncharacterized membrane protein YhdT
MLIVSQEIFMTGARRWILGGTVGVIVALVIAYLTQAFSDMITHQRWINFASNLACVGQRILSIICV